MDIMRPFDFWQNLISQKKSTRMISMQAPTQKNEWLMDDTYVKVVGFVVVHVQCPEQLWVPANCNVFDIADAVNDGLAGELLHLDVVELPEVTEPLDQLGGDAAVELEMERKHPLILFTSLLQGIKGTLPRPPVMTANESRVHPFQDERNM